MGDTISEERTRNYINQIKGSFVFKALAVIASFLTIPLMIRYLGEELFGVWSTLLSIMSWIVFFDMGIGIGLRNKLAESLARNNRAEAALYVSSGYSLLGLVSLLLFALVATVAFFVPWRMVFNTNVLAETVLRKTVLIAAFFIFLNFWISLIQQVLNAVQKTSSVIMGQFISNVLALVLILILVETTDASLPYLAAAYGVSINISNVLLSIWFYRQRSDLFPRPSINSRHVRPLLSLGLQFFTIQIAVLILFATDKILITQLFGPQYVTQYEVVFRVFSVITLIHALITAPLWSSYTDAYHRGDFKWIKEILEKQILLFGAIILMTILLVLMAKYIIALWIGVDFEVSIALIISMGVFVLVTTWNNIFAYFLNGIQKIKVSRLAAIIAMCFNIPISIFLAKHSTLEASAVVLGTIVSLLPAAFLGPYQVRMIMRRKDVGIWSR